MEVNFFPHRYARAAYEELTGSSYQGYQDNDRDLDQSASLWKQIEEEKTSQSMALQSGSEVKIELQPVLSIRRSAKIQSKSIPSTFPKQSNNQTIKQSNNQTIKQSNNQTIKQSNNQTTKQSKRKHYYLNSQGFGRR